MLGICNGFQALIKLGLLVPYGEIRDIDENAPTLTYNKIGRHQSKIVQTRVASTLSPWLTNLKMGDTHIIPVSHGEGRFVASEEMIKKLFANRQVATQYVDFNGMPSYEILTKLSSLMAQCMLLKALQVQMEEFLEKWPL